MAAELFDKDGRMDRQPSRHCHSLFGNYRRA